MSHAPKLSTGVGQVVRLKMICDSCSTLYALITQGEVSESQRHPAGTQRMRFMDVMVTITMDTVCALRSLEVDEEVEGRGWWSFGRHEGKIWSPGTTLRVQGYRLR